MTRWTYFATDGSYGDAQDLIVVDTTNWTDEHWDNITYCRDDALTGVAESICLGLDNYTYTHQGVIKSARTAKGGVSYDRT